MVTGEPRTAHGAAGPPGLRTQWEIDEQTTLGAAYVRSLMRSQLRAGISAFVVLAAPVAVLPLFFGALRNAAVEWLVLGFGCYPFLVLIAWWYVRRAERNERDFAALVRGRDTKDPGAP
ncbi:hypothetical protein GTY65_04155 [Streptomyces sp. SID8379]|uniref:hypothetical protein n=1 Tax=Streptomyces sp. SID8379 TaxID=2690359 RepID=UPI0003A5FA68|nr:hypothetical protein [Streptomyces sp. HmicA12]MYW63275.1 hypothetical protein [Streptomyces sp. SID8379]